MSDVTEVRYAGVAQLSRDQWLALRDALATAGYALAFQTDAMRWRLVDESALPPTDARDLSVAGTAAAGRDFARLEFASGTKRNRVRVHSGVDRKFFAALTASLASTLGGTRSDDKPPRVTPRFDVQTIDGLGVLTMICARTFAARDWLALDATLELASETATSFVMRMRTAAMRIEVRPLDSGRATASITIDTKQQPLTAGLVDAVVARARTLFAAAQTKLGLQYEDFATTFYASDAP